MVLNKYNKGGKMKTLVTKHPALVLYLLEKGIITNRDVEVVKSPTSLKGKDVIGVDLPYELTSQMKSYTNVVLNLPKELRDKELSLQNIRDNIGDITTYVVRKVE